MSNKGTFLYFTAVLLLTMFICGQSFYFALPVRSPAISVRITRDYCPSVEVQAGMRIAWTNLDNVDRTLIVEKANRLGEVEDSGGTDLLPPGDTFSLSLKDAGQYTYYCSSSRTASGTITVQQ